MRARVGRWVDECIARRIEAGARSWGVVDAEAYFSSLGCGVSTIISIRGMA